MMTKHLRPALVAWLLLTLLTGVLYPLIVTGMAQGSVLIGQSFDTPEYFWGRLSATGSFPYNAAASSGSNLGPLNDALTDVVAQHTEGRLFGLLGEPRVNVLELNLALDKEK